MNVELNNELYNNDCIYQVIFIILFYFCIFLFIYFMVYRFYGLYIYGCCFVWI